jgi:hypothetical protein
MATRISYHIRRLSRRLWVAKKIDAEIYPEDNDTSTTLISSYNTFG